MTATQVGFALAGVAALIYGLVFQSRPPSPWRTVARFAGAAALSVTARLADAPTFLGLALALCAVSDAALGAHPKRYLPAGLAALAAAHLAYAVLFTEIGAPTLMLSDPVRGGATLAVAASGAGLALLCWRRLGPLRTPALAAGAGGALLLGLAITLSADFWPAMVGTVLLLASDILLARGLLRDRPPPAAAWWLYAAAQGAVAWAFLRP